MLGRFKGFNVPRRDFKRLRENIPKTALQRLCFLTNTDDCQECEKCILCTFIGRATGDEASKSGSSYKGKVEYDA